MLKTHSVIEEFRVKCAVEHLIATFHSKFRVHVKSQGKRIRNYALRRLRSPYIITELKHPTAKTLSK
jgi:hypothetical protein